MYLIDKNLMPQPDTSLKPFTNAHLIAWLRTQNPDGTYCYDSTGRCLIGRYCLHAGLKNPAVGGFTYDTDSERDIQLPEGWNSVAQDSPRTFGAALERALATLHQ